MTVKEIAQAIFNFNEEKKTAENMKLEENIKKKQIKYPYQVASIKRTKKVLGVDAKLSVPDANANGYSPFEIHSGFSRFEFTIVDKDMNITPTANIPAEDIFYIAEASRIALKELLTGAPTSSSETISVAYTQKLIDKNFRGKTPAEVLLADNNQVNNLMSVKSWLEANVAKFPANKQQIIAIQEAVDLLNRGELKPLDNAVTTSNITIYKTDYKFKSKKNEKGYNLIYGIDIVCDPDKNYPFAINIMNCYAPVETGANGNKTIKMNVAENTIKSSLLVTKEEWMKLILKLERTTEMFEEQNFERFLKESDIAVRQNINANKN